MSDYSVMDLALHTEGFMGTPVFDYINEPQLRDIAQGLGLDLDVSRRVSLTDEAGVGFKVSVKVIESQLGRKVQRGEEVDRAGALATTVALSVMARLQGRHALAAFNHATAEELNKALLDQGGMWTVIQGTWRAERQEDTTSLRLTTTPVGDATGEALELQVVVPDGPDELTASGRLRLVDRACVTAHVLAQPLSSQVTPAVYRYVAHAVFDCVGAQDFRWQGASSPGGGSGDDF